MKESYYKKCPLPSMIDVTGLYTAFQKTMPPATGSDGERHAHGVLHLPEPDLRQPWPHHPQQLGADGRRIHLLPAQSGAAGAGGSF